MTEKITIKCKNCGRELPPGAQFCDSCGARVTPEIKRQPPSAEKAGGSRVKAVAAAGIIVLLAVIISAVFISNRIDTARDADETEAAEKRFAAMESRITPEQYGKLDFGMSYEEVTDLLGEEGTQQYSRYLWPGEYFDEAEYVYDAPRIELEFGDNMKLIGIKEYNVLLGKEIYEAKKEGRVSQVTVNDEVLASMRNRMSYREIADILGAEGVLEEAESDKSGFDRKQYVWRYVKEGENSSYGRYLSISFYNDKARRSDYDEWGK